MKAGFIGLGAMGLPMAQNLVQSGHRITVYNRTRSRADAAAASGAAIAATPGGACADGVVMTMLADDRAVESVTFGAGGLLDSLAAGGVHVSMSTISVALSERLARAHQERDQKFVSSPVFGRPDAAAARRLVVVAAGATDAVERVRPLLDAVGRKLFVVGAEPSAANAVKLGGNFMIASMLETLGEALALARKHGVESPQFLEIANAVFQSPVYEGYGKVIVEKRFEPAGFRMELGLKDVRLVLAAADSAAVPMPAASVIYGHLLAAVAQGRREIDWSAVTELIAENAGIKS